MDNSNWRRSHQISFLKRRAPSKVFYQAWWFWTVVVVAALILSNKQYRTMIMHEFYAVGRAVGVV
jgi:hypothetical protein